MYKEWEYKTLMHNQATTYTQKQESLAYVNKMTMDDEFGIGSFLAFQEGYYSTYAGPSAVLTFHLEGSSRKMSRLRAS